MQEPDSHTTSIDRPSSLICILRFASSSRKPTLQLLRTTICYLIGIIIHIIVSLDFTADTFDTRVRHAISRPPSRQPVHTAEPARCGGRKQPRPPEPVAAVPYDAMHADLWRPGCCRFGDGLELIACDLVNFLWQLG